jgi:DNA-binding MarR family transcriptional regulator
MNELAEMTNTSPSRLSHLVKRLEKQGWAYRERDADDGRFINAHLTDDGLHALARAAPAHVETVRRLVIDVLTPEQLRRFALDSERITRRIGFSSR